MRDCAANTGTLQCRGRVHTVSIAAANQEDFRKPFHLILNLSIGGQFTAAQPDQANFPLFMNVDYVRVWQRQ